MTCNGHIEIRLTMIVLRCKFFSPAMRFSSMQRSFIGLGKTDLAPYSRTRYARASFSCSSHIFLTLPYIAAWRSAISASLRSFSALLAMSMASLLLAMRNASLEVRQNPTVVSKNPWRMTTGWRPIFFRSRIHFASKMRSISSAFMVLSHCEDENGHGCANT